VSATCVQPLLDLHRSVISTLGRTASMTAAFPSTTISLSAGRKIRLRVATVGAGCAHAQSRSAPSCIRCYRSC